jgi:hypothetical protein
MADIRHPDLFRVSAFVALIRTRSVLDRIGFFATMSAFHPSVLWGMHGYEEMCR